MIKRIPLMAAAMMAALPTVALADVHRHVTGTFADGTTLNGFFDLNVYGYLSAASLTTQTGPVLTHFTYTTGNSSHGEGANFVDFQPGYLSDLHLVFANPVSASGVDPVAVGSYECQGSYGCYNASGGAIRTLVSGTATVPEPATWALLVAGFAVVGGAARRRKLAAV